MKQIGVATQKRGGVLDHRLISVIGMALVIATASACEDKGSDQAQIEAQLRGGAKAIEDNQISDAAEVLAEQYRDKNKRDKVTLKRIAVLMRRRGPVGLFLRDVDIKLNNIDAVVASEGDAPDGSTANVTMNVYALQGQKSPKVAADLIPQGARKLEVTLTMQKIDGTWLVTSMAGDKMRPL